MTGSPLSAAASFVGGVAGLFADPVILLLGVIVGVTYAAMAKGDWKFPLAAVAVLMLAGAITIPDFYRWGPDYAWGLVFRRTIALWILAALTQVLARLVRNWS